jgi:hypothetical protein
MKLDVFVSAAMAGLAADREEITVGLAKVLRIGSRIAPQRLVNVLRTRTRRYMAEHTQAAPK